MTDELAEPLADSAGARADADLLEDVAEAYPDAATDDLLPGDADEVVGEEEEVES